MSDEIYERDLNQLLFEGQNRLDEFTRNKMTIIQHGDGLHDEYLGAMQHCVAKLDEVLAMERHLATRFQRMLPAVQLHAVEADEPLPRFVQNNSATEDAVARVAQVLHDERHPFLKRIAS